MAAKPANEIFKVAKSDGGWDRSQLRRFLKRIAR